jgi:glycosyltransferase involved in cell wall biosynthesis
MRLAINALLLDAAPTGLGVYTENVLREFSRLIPRQHAVSLYAPFLVNVNGLDSASWQMRKLPSCIDTRYGVKAAFARFLWTQLLLPIAVRNHHVFYSPTHHGLLSGRIKQILTIHDLLPVKFPSQYRLQHYYFTCILPHMLSRAAAIIVDSKSTRNDVHQYYGVSLEKLYVVHAAISPVFKPWSTDAVRRIRAKYGLGDFILTVGASFPHKNLETAIHAIASLRDAMRMEWVVVGGRKEYIETLKREAGRLNLQTIKFLEYVPQEELPGLYAAATALLYPSLYEGFGLPPLEAMACGCPVVVSNTSSLPEVCGDAAYYVDPHDAKAIAEGVFKVATDSHLRESLRERGTKRAETFSWARAAADVYRVIEKISAQVA